MRKLFVFLLVLLMVLSLVACGNQNPSNDNTPGSTPESSQSPSDTSSKNDDKDTAWYYQGFQLEFHDTDWSGAMYCDGKSLWYKATSISK
ncbi:MAG TPA: hypothetical protein PLT66_03295, partial [Bacillota bacterium]|nr:hypothetical protein [Bacillota bacterium]